MLIGFTSRTVNEVQANDPVDALVEAGCQRIVQAVRESERQSLLIAVLGVMVPGDTLVVTDLDTLNCDKSLADLLCDLHARGLRVQSLAENFDSYHSNPSTGGSPAMRPH